MNFRLPATLPQAFDNWIGCSRVKESPPRLLLSTERCVEEREPRVANPALPLDRRAEYSYGQAVVPAVVPEGPGTLPKFAAKKPKSPMPTTRPGTQIGSLC